MLANGANRFTDRKTASNWACAVNLLSLRKPMSRLNQDAGPNALVLKMRLPDELRDRIDRVLARRPIKPSRNTWVLEAGLEKLARDEPRGKGHGAR